MYEDKCPHTQLSCDIINKIFQVFAQPEQNLIKSKYNGKRNTFDRLVRMLAKFIVQKVNKVNRDLLSVGSYSNTKYAKPD